MDDLSSTISQFLSNPVNVQQLQSMAASMGLLDGQASPSAPSPAAEPPQNRQNGGQPPHDIAAPLEAARQRNSAGNIDLSALSSLLDRLTGSPQQSQQPASSDISSLLDMLGGGNTEPPSPPPPADNATPDLSALLNMLGGSTRQQSPQPPPQNGTSPDLSALLGKLNLNGGTQGGGSPDLSSLLGMLGGAGGNPAPQPDNAGGLNLSALSSLLGGTGGGTSSGSGLPGMDFNALMGIQKAMSMLSSGNENVRILLSLKSHLKTERAQKVDDAVRVMQLIQFLPLIKESGLLGSLGLDGFLDSFSLKNLGIDALSKLNLSGGR